MITNKRFIVSVTSFFSLCLFFTTFDFSFASVLVGMNQIAFNEQRKFIGQEYDADTGLNYLNARYYDAKRGQFISQDPNFWAIGDEKQVKALTGKTQQEILADPQLLNSYSYARNNPIINSDPTGNGPELLLLPLLMYAPQITSFAQSLLTPLGQFGINQATEDAKKGNYGWAAFGFATSGEVPGGKSVRGVSNFVDHTVRYGEEIGSKMNQVAKVFQNEGISASEHSILRTVTREIRGITPEKVINTFKNGSQYLDSKYPKTINYFGGGIRLVVDKITQEIKTVVTQNKMNIDRFTKIK